ncbi:unnamed protein product [Mytilus coruscus]|uniref:Reverse transcriptase domain-containing protein n=1 Tax=Mytilus coruscus TaxID=42192 RepID=A0A6J8ALF3_MYTCO|nr:unnamed protein product [Mytilus coruscus]
MQVTSFLRKLDILTLQYIDDLLLIASDKPHLPHGNINKISYAFVELLTRLGYTLSIKKSRFNPSKTIKFSDFFIDSEQKCFRLPSEKKLTFIALRELILKSEKVSVKTLQRFAGSIVCNHRLDILKDNKSVIAVWEKQGGRDKLFNDIVKDLFMLLCEYNIDLRLQYIQSSLNDADATSQSVSLVDSKLSVESWSRIECTYGPHTVDLMSLDSNAMTTTSGLKLKHFTLAPSPLSTGVNIFAQDVSLETNPYVYPPLNLIFQVLTFLKEQRAVVVDLKRIDDRIMQLHNQSIDSSHRRRRESLQESFSDFLDILTHKPCLDTVSPHDVKRFLVWKDSYGKTQIHVKSCINLGKKGVTGCLCPI